MKLIRFVYEEKCLNGSLAEDGASVLVQDDNGIIPVDEITLLAPVVPSKVVSVGLNYKDHAKELGMELPEEPIIFIKPATTVIGYGQEIICPLGMGRIDHEAELGIVIKDKIKNIPAKEAKDHILGYTCFNDVTARDLQKKDGQWTRAKSFDTFAPIGPWIETDLDSSSLIIRSYVNGSLRQYSNTKEFIFDVPKVIEFISGVMTLLPGDVISTGTPSNVGEIKPGDTVVVEIEGIGKLENPVTAG